jgi:Zn-dependent protease
MQFSYQEMPNMIPIMYYHANMGVVWTKHSDRLLSMPEQKSLGLWLGGGAAGDNGFGAFLHVAAGEQDTPVTGEALQTDVSAQAHDAPLVTAAGVRLAQAEDVVQVEVERFERRHVSADRTEASGPAPTLYTRRTPHQAASGACYNPFTFGDCMLLGLTLPILAAILITLIIALSFHELAHAWTADQLGDNTPRCTGRLTVNPLAHLDPLGSLLFVFAGFGWAKPVPVNPYNLRNGPRLGMAVVAAAGPLANLLLALIAAVPIRAGFLQGNALNGLEPYILLFIQLNLNLMLFNLIPLVPLDGSKVLRGFAPREWDRWLAPLEQWGMFILIALIFLGSFSRISILGLIIGPPAEFLLNAILGR